jgi:hypothetical protein
MSEDVVGDERRKHKHDRDTQDHEPTLGQRVAGCSAEHVATSRCGQRQQSGVRV